ncbi:MAG: J domain-containing protein [Synechococcales cyanobacterium RM1_1_8]|nr:J domain-containing protein [Synechococcales cyanobacterium RM1_1_8]
MAQSDFYKLLGLTPSATAAAIKLAYRTKAKQCHPDRQGLGTDAIRQAHEATVALNAAYEVLGDPQRRRDYDQQRQGGKGRRQNHSGPAPYQSYADYARASGVEPNSTAEASGTKPAQGRRPSRRALEVDLEDWMRQVYNPVSRLIHQVVRSLNAQINALAADPFDDELMDQFVAYLEDCRKTQEKAQAKFNSLANPPLAAGPASKLYYAINHLGDGVDELERFTTSYEESYIHSGKEMFRRARQFRQEAQESLKRMGR